MKIHILGICGTFMSGVALLARALGHQVEGTDQNIYPPMSTQLEKLGIQLFNGYSTDHLHDVDCVIVGNVIKRGNPAIEYILNHQIPYYSGPQWLFENVLKDKWVIAVAGTHGKTTTSSMLAHILDHAGLNPGFLIGGVPENFGRSARLSDSKYFVIEADEYDAAFFDKRSKFLHYHPKTLILNNLEFDHADIFPNLAAIVQQFQYLIRTVPGEGLIIHPSHDANVQSAIDLGCWSQCETFGDGDKPAAWQAQLMNADGSHFQVKFQNECVAEVKWPLIGLHNVHNALASFACASQLGIDAQCTAEALTRFKSVKRRLEVRGKVREITVYDDFAHHPTAIKTTLAGLRARIGPKRIIALMEFGSFTMRSGYHRARISESLQEADLIYCKIPMDDWGVVASLEHLAERSFAHRETDELLKQLVPKLLAGDHVIIMSNGAFDGIHEKLMAALS